MEVKKNLIYFIVLILIFNPFFYTLVASSREVNLENDTQTSIILFIGDGMGTEQIRFGQLVEYGTDKVSSLFDFPYSKQVSTNNIYGRTTDSAAAATAISTGVKTENGRIATNWNASKELTTILEIAQMNGYVTGLVATSHLTHATPAAFAAHEAKRGSYLKIAKDFSKSDVDIFFGGGSSNDYFGNYISNFTDNGYTYITQEMVLNNLNTTPVLGLFTEKSLPRVYTMEEDSPIPSLSEMTTRAIELLNATSKPFFLMVEGSQIDWAGHDKDPIYLAHEMIEFEKTISSVKSLAEEQPNWQVLVTADHETGGLSVKDYSFQTNAPLETDSFEIKKEKRTNRSKDIEVSWTAGHTKTKVILAGMGPFTEKILNAKHHIDTFSIMREAIDGLTEPYEEGYSRDYHIIPYYAWIIIGIGVVIIPTTVIIVRKKKTN
ncbi:MAG: alkaline phosphatase [Candidatus Heimdallarchaeaceae archaeon]|jgi:alkaline phosphatase